MHRFVTEMMSLFEGYSKNYGSYRLTGEIDERGKALGVAHSLRGDVTVELWHDHLTGKQGLGVIPINELSKVKFAAIDIDEYGLQLSPIAHNLRDAKIPLIPCRTKSGGIHLYLFLSDWAPAKNVQIKMREIAAYLGYGNSEIFPKQTKILAERGDVGQWINVPYFDESRTERYAVNEVGKKLSLEEFVKYAQSKIISPEELVSLVLTDPNADPLPGGPPCLNSLCSRGFPEGTRNNGLLNVGLYLQKAHPDTWESLMNTYNSKYMSPPLTEVEVRGVIKSLKKRPYQYTCKQQPISSFCNSGKCRGAKHGIGATGVGMPKRGTLCKIATTPAVWFVDVEGGGRVELETEDLQFVKRYQTRCMECLSVMPPLVKAEVWSDIVGQLMEDVTVVEVPEEATPRGMLYQYLEEFCTSRVQGKSHDELLLGKPWSYNKYVYFRLRDFMDFLRRQKFNEYKMNKIAVYLQDWGVVKDFFNIKGKGVNVCRIKEFKRQDTGFQVPGIEVEDKI